VCANTHHATFAMADLCDGGPLRWRTGISYRWLDIRQQYSLAGGWPNSI